MYQHAVSRHGRAKTNTITLTTNNTQAWDFEKVETSETRGVRGHAPPRQIPTLKSTQSEGTLGWFKHHNQAFLNHQILFFFFFFLYSRCCDCCMQHFGTDKASCCSTHIDFAKVSCNALVGLSNFHNLGNPFPLPFVLYSNFLKYTVKHVFSG